MKRKPILFSVAGMLALSMILTGCGKENSSSINNAASQEASASIEDYITTASSNSSTAKSLVEEINYNAADGLEADCVIKLNGNSASIDGDGAYFVDGVITINSAGTYEITGSLNGRIEVDAQKEDTVNIILNGVEVSCDDYAPFTVLQADKTLIYLREGTTNTFTDRETYTALTADESEDDIPTAAIFSKDDLEFAGQGKLVVNASCNDGIAGKDDVVFESGSYEITTNDDGIVGKDSVAVKDAEIKITAGGDGIKSTEDTDEEKGFISIESGTFNIEAQNDAIQAETYCYIADGVFELTTKASSVNSYSTATEEESAKGIKAGVDITILNGEFNITATDDAIHSNDTTTVEGGCFEISSGDDGIHAENVLLIKNGNINVNESYEGLEAENIVIKAGDLNITASDDGINAAGGDTTEGTDSAVANADDEVPQMPDDSVMPEGEAPQMNGSGGMPEGEAPQMNSNGGMPEGEAPQMNGNVQNQDNGGRQNGDMPKMQGNGQRQNNGNMQNAGVMDNGVGTICIEGGNLYVNAGGDGLDANSSIYVNGGTVYVDGPVNDGNGFFDYGSTFEVTGGTIVSSGSSGMMQTFSDTSSQAGLAVVFDSTCSAGTTVTLKDSDGKEIISYSPSKSFNAIAISTAELEVNESYEIFLNGDSYKTIELSSVSVTDGSSGNGMKGNRGGGMQGGRGSMQNHTDTGDTF